MGNEHLSYCLTINIVLIYDDELRADFIFAQDLEQYASSYSGLMRIERLQFIADHCPQLRVEALKMALSFVQRTFNVDVYEEIHRKLTEATRQFKFMSFLQPNMVSSWKHYMYDFEKGRTKSLIIVSTQGCARCPRCGTGGGS